MKTRIMSFMLIATIVLAVSSGCRLEVQSPPEEAPAGTPLALEEDAPAETPSVLKETAPPPALEEVAPPETSLVGSLLIQ